MSRASELHGFLNTTRIAFGSSSLRSRSYRRIPIEAINPNPNQPRKHFDKQSLQDLAESIRRVGVLNPIVVEHRDGKYVIVAGDRRYRASLIAKLSSMPALILEPNHQALEVSLIENLQREDLHPLEEAHAFSEILQTGVTQEDLGKRVGKSNVYISECLGLLRLHEQIQAEWFLNREIVAKYKMKEVSRLDEIEQLEVWKSITGQTERRVVTASKRNSDRLPPPKTVFSKVNQIAAFLDKVDVSRWRPTTRQKLKDDVDTAISRLESLRAQLDDSE